VIKQNFEKVASVICSTLWYFFTCAGEWGKGWDEVKEGENMVSLWDLLTLISPSVYLIQAASSSTWREWEYSDKKKL